MSLDHHSVKHGGGEFKINATQFANDAAATASFGAGLADGCYYYNTSWEQFRYYIDGAWSCRHFKPICIHATPVAGQAVLDNVFENFKFTNIVVDNSAAVGFPGIYVGATGIFTAPREGDYAVTGQISVKDVDNEVDNIRVEFYVNGGQKSQGRLERRQPEYTDPLLINTEYASAQHHSVVKLNAGDTLEVKYLYGHGATGVGAIADEPGLNYLIIQEV